ncbi:hypothetical protein AGMMS50276_13800 [Synergistales bacterium]|nr:hypothetical protein AGMMS50276_13800 [Synergistales bacterium]
MNNRDAAQIERIAEEVSFIQKSVLGKSKEMFLQDELLQRAMTMALITIGECANHLSEAFLEQNDEIEWFKIVAVRNIAVHGYWQLNMEQIWQALIDDIPVLNSFLKGFAL